MFADHTSKIDSESLRTYTFSRLKDMKQQVEYLLTDERFKDFWNGLHMEIVDTFTDDELLAFLKAEREITHLDQYIESWERTAVDSAERFAFFVKTKAQEIRSGDQNKDYFWALQIRHDQLIALVRVLELLIDTIKRWVALKPAEVLNDPVFAGITEVGIDSQVYLEAEKVYKERQKLLQSN